MGIRNSGLYSALDRLRKEKEQAGAMPAGWHPPLMPNQPRDPKKDRHEPDPGSGLSAADLGQDPYSKALPGEEEMAKMNGAMRLPPVLPSAPASMKDFAGIDTGESQYPDFDPTASDEAKEAARQSGAAMLVSVNPSSYFGDQKPMQKPVGPAQFRKLNGLMKENTDNPFSLDDQPMSPDLPYMDTPEGGDYGAGPIAPQPESTELLPESQPETSDPLEGFPEEIPTEDLTDEIDVDTGSNPDQSAGQPQSNAQSALADYMKQMNAGQPSEQARDDRLSDVMRASQQGNSRLGLYQLLMSAANKAGSINGQMSSDKPFNDFTAQQIGQNNEMGNLVQKDRKTEKARADEKLKGMMFMAKQEQDKQRYQGELQHRAKQLEELSGYHKESLGVQREANEGRNRLIDATLRAQMGLGYDKLNLSEREMITKLAMEEEKLNLKRNPPVKPMSELDQEELKARKRENGWLAQGLDKNGRPIKTKVQEIQEKEAAEVYGDWIQKGGKANVEQNIEKLKAVKAAILGDKMASGPILGWVPESAQTFAGMKGPTYKSDVEDAISSTFKETLGGNFTLTEGEGLKKNAYDPKQTPEENARRVQRVIDKMEAGKRAKDQTVKYLDDNGGIQMPAGAPLSQSKVPPAPPGMVNIQGPEGDIRAVPKASAQKYLDKGGKLVQ